MPVWSKVHAKRPRYYRTGERKSKRKNPGLDGTSEEELMASPVGCRVTYGSR